jgi:hypothetical protein
MSSPSSGRLRRRRRNVARRRAARWGRVSGAGDCRGA